MPHRLTLLLTLLVSALAVAAVWSYAQLADARAAAAGAGADTATCRKLVNAIEAWRTEPDIGAAGEMQINELTHRIEQAARAAGMSLDSLVRIWPEPPRRVADTVYLEKRTHVLLRRVTIRQLVTLLSALTSEPASLRVSALRLTAPRGNEAGNQWTAETTLTHLVYAPPHESDYQP